MKAKMLKSGLIKIHIEDGDTYNLTGDNGVDVWMTEEQVGQIMDAVAKKREAVRGRAGASEDCPSRTYQRRISEM